MPLIIKANGFILFNIILILDIVGKILIHSSLYYLLFARFSSVSLYCKNMQDYVVLLYVQLRLQGHLVKSEFRRKNYMTILVMSCLREVDLKFLPIIWICYNKILTRLEFFRIEPNSLGLLCKLLVESTMNTRSN